MEKSIVTKKGALANDAGPKLPGEEHCHQKRALSHDTKHETPKYDTRPKMLGEKSHQKVALAYTRLEVPRDDYD